MATATADHNRTATFYRWMSLRVADKELPPHLFAASLHESGHLTACLAFGIAPPATRVYLDENGHACGGCYWRNYPTVADRKPRTRATITAAGATAARMLLDDDNNACLTSDADVKHILAEGLTFEAVQNDAGCLLRKHLTALGRLAVDLVNAGTLTQTALMRLLTTHPEMKSLLTAYMAWGGK